MIDSTVNWRWHRSRQAWNWCSYELEKIGWNPQETHWSGPCFLKSFRSFSHFLFSKSQIRMVGDAWFSCFIQIIIEKHHWKRKKVCGSETNDGIWKYEMIKHLWWNKEEETKRKKRYKKEEDIVLMCCGSWVYIIHALGLLWWIGHGSGVCIGLSPYQHKKLPRSKSNWVGPIEVLYKKHIFVVIYF
jgi:hypothetical protein